MKKKHIYLLIWYECGAEKGRVETDDKKLARDYFRGSDGYSDCVDLYIDGQRIPFARAAKALGFRGKLNPEGAGHENQKHSQNMQKKQSAL